jgi:hypothetical protein
MLRIIIAAIAAALLCGCASSGAYDQQFVTGYNSKGKPNEWVIAAPNPAWKNFHTPRSHGFTSLNPTRGAVTQ